MKSTQYSCSILIVATIIAVLSYLGIAALVMLSWNALANSVRLPAISYWAALGAVFLLSVLGNSIRSTLRRGE